jgi:predicted NBD/HSP70 family sugar kinase
MTGIGLPKHHPQDLGPETRLVLHLIRSGQAQTRSDVGRVGNLGRTVVSRCLDELFALGLAFEGDTTTSRGGRAPHEVRLNANAGTVFVAEFGVTAIRVGVTDLSGIMQAVVGGAWRIEEGPEASLNHAISLLRSILPEVDWPKLWGIGIGVPGPVEFATGRPISPPNMPTWDGYDIRGRLAQSFDAPVWVDNDVNIMALGELRAGAALGERNVVVVKVGTNIGAGLVFDGRIHRGTRGSAGDIGHIAVVGSSSSGLKQRCRCGKEGCVEAIASGAAITRDARTAQGQGASPFLDSVLAEGHEIDIGAVVSGSMQGDAVCKSLLAAAADHIGAAISSVVNICNPSMVVLGGSVIGDSAVAGDTFLAMVRSQVYSLSSPLASRDLRIVRSTLGLLGSATGAGHLVLDGLFGVHEPLAS